MRDVGLVLVIGILLWEANSINGKTDESDASALRVMFSSLNSPSKLSKWKSSGGDPCKEHWQGITCKGSRVAEIKIPDLGLTGSLGYMLTSLTALTIFDISNNKLGNEIPYQLPPKLQLLNLAGNGFTGSIPFSISQITSLRYLNLGHNNLQGQLYDIFGAFSSLAVLDLSFNSLTGPLPGSFSSLSKLNSLYLQNNQFTGPINVLGNLPLDNLNVANNRFSGWIPDQLKNINLQKDGGNSWSSGPAPPPPPGTPPLNKKKRSGGGSNSSNSSKKSGMGGGGVAAIVVSIIVVGAVVAFFIVKRRSRNPSADVEKRDDQPFVPLASHKVQELKSTQTASTLDTKPYEMSASMNLRPPPVERQKSFGSDDLSRKPAATRKIRSSSIKAISYSIADLQIATDSFSSEALIGEGSIGRVYRSHFDDGKVLAVKKLSSSSFPSHLSADFMEVVSDVSRLRHPNITELVGYCSEHGQKLLVYEFHDSGSLHDFLHLSDEYSKPLSWNHRVKIALGTARALEYLHEVCSPSVVHKNFNSANILLDTDLNPHLSDCGLANFVSDEDQALNHNVGSGYAAPEVSMSGQYTIKSDVYSFGVVMLELLSGRKPFDSSRPRAEQSLVRWATPQLHDIDALSKMVDPALEGLYPVKSLSRFADAIALCVQSEPEFRPPMSEVVQTLVVLVQRANMSKRTVGNDQGPSRPDDYA